MTNAEMGLKAAMANQEAAMKAAQQRLAGTTQAMNMREEIAARRGAGISANLTNFFNSLGEIGREEYSRNMIMSNPALYYSIDSKGNMVIQLSLIKESSFLSDEEKAIIIIQSNNGTPSLNVYYGSSVDMDFVAVENLEIERGVESLKSFCKSCCIKKGEIGAVVIVASDKDTYDKVTGDDFFKDFYVLLGE